MATKKNKGAQHDPEVAIESAINRSEGFIYKNGKTLLTVLAVVAVIVCGYYGYEYFIQNARNQKAADMMFVAEQLFEQGDYDGALEGDGNNAGFIDVIGKYGSTVSGNIAKHYAGVAYKELGDLDKAMEYLSKYKKVKGVPGALINAQNIGLQGDILSQRGDIAGAVKKYEEAVSVGDNSFTSPVYLKKAGIAYEALGKRDEAVRAFQKLADTYPTSLEARDIEKYIGVAEQN